MKDIEREKTNILSKVFEKQWVLDQHYKSHPQILLDYSFDKKLIAFFVEIAEFLNEIEVFKYWKITKKHDNKLKILEEFVDGLHFLASIGLELNYQAFEFRWEVSSQSFVELIKELYLQYAYFLNSKDKTEEQYRKIAITFFQIVINLGFSAKEVLQAFTLKNQLNLTRIQQNY